MQQKLFLLAVFVFVAITIFAQSKKQIALKQYTYLALGDSYTIGESVPVYDNFPYQTVQLLRKSGISIHAPEIVARTGWTTDELQQGIRKTLLQPAYDIVTLLIGVNNQYRGYNIKAYAQEFEELLQQAINFAGQKPQQVVVLSIPDWGATPFAEGKDIANIMAAIDQYNAINKKITADYQAHYIDITPGTREARHHKELVAADGLHPSGRDYARWADQLSGLLQRQLQ